jgi:hypothetical protein
VAVGDRVEVKWGPLAGHKGLVVTVERVRDRDGHWVWVDWACFCDEMHRTPLGYLRINPPSQPATPPGCTGSEGGEGGA